MTDKRNWIEDNPTCVVMCGGKSSRFGSKGHKSATDVLGNPLIFYVIEYWKAFTDDFVFVVKHGKEPLMEYINTLPIRARFVEPERLGGIAHGLSYAEPLVDGPFILVLGDCFCSGQFDFTNTFDYGIGVIASNEEQIKQNYSVIKNEASLVTHVQEKPVVVESDLCGTGFYFFQKDIFDYIRKTGPSARTGEQEITDVLETLLRSGIPLQGVDLEGVYVNVTTPADLLTVRAALERQQ